MWIKKAEYERLKLEAEENKQDAEMHRFLFQPHTTNTIRLHDDFVIMKRNAFDEALSQQKVDEDILKDLRAELEWYKVKYHEMKMITEGVRRIE